MIERTIEFASPDGPVPGWEAVRDGGAERAVVVIQEAFGLNDHIRDVAGRFASAGYHAVAPNLFHRAGGGTAPYDDIAQTAPLFKGLRDETVLADVGAALGHLRDAGHADGAIGVIGFCIGGRFSFLVALERGLGAAVTLYGGSIVSSKMPKFQPLVDRAGELRTPWLGLYGDRDEAIPTDDVERLRAATAAAPVPTEIIRYPEAGHGFFCDAREAFHPASAADAWERVLGWFDRRLG
ncbi:MAG TPA: dienelactone hydrolase family protein [Solirubrobacteraceae bacterium]|nr:dienelactone hydrolase family protein [Solirubrobacteraceae bacterium]